MIHKRIAEAITASPSAFDDIYDGMLDEIDQAIVEAVLELE